MISVCFIAKLSRYILFTETFFALDGGGINVFLEPLANSGVHFDVDGTIKHKINHNELAQKG